MMAGSHLALGAAAWLVAAPHLGLPAAAPACLGLALVGSLLPDIDHPKSWAGKRLGPLSSGIAAVVGHRGMTHSAVALAACTWCLLHSGTPRWVVSPLAVGYLSHLAADLLTPGGLRLAWPLRRTWALPLCKSGSPFEPLVVALLLSWAGSGTLVPPLLREVWDQSGTAWRTPHDAVHRPKTATDTRLRAQSRRVALTASAGMENTGRGIE